MQKEMGYYTAKKSEARKPSAMAREQRPRNSVPTTKSGKTRKSQRRGSSPHPHIYRCTTKLTSPTTYTSSLYPTHRPMAGCVTLAFGLRLCPAWIDQLTRLVVVWKNALCEPVTVQGTPVWNLVGFRSNSPRGFWQF